MTFPLFILFYVETMAPSLGGIRKDIFCARKMLLSLTTQLIENMVRVAVYVHTQKLRYLLS
jgi:hypothetical protein